MFDSREYRIRYESSISSLVWHVSNDGTDENIGRLSIPISEVPVNEWHYLAGTWYNETGEFLFYLDGTLYNSSTYNTPKLFDGTANFSIGSSGNSDAGGSTDDFNGIIDDVKIYNRALTPAEIMGNYNEGLGNLTDYQIKIEKGLVGSWHFSQNTGTTAT